MPELRKLNFRSAPDSKLLISADSIPTLVPAESLALFQAGDEKPYFKVQAIDYPTKANGWTYTEEFWKSYIGKLNAAPIPGSARGHETRWGARGATDLIVVGGRVDAKGDGSGTVYLKNYIPPKGESGDNSVFIAMNKAGMVDYSIVSYTRDVIENQPDGEVTRMCVESLYGERNDCVDLGTGAMDMKTNADALPKEQERALSLIETGAFDKTSKWNGEGDLELSPGFAYGKAGRVYYSALRQSANRAKETGNLDVADVAVTLIRAIDRYKQNREKKPVEKAEILEGVKTLKQNAELTLPEVAKAMGLEGQLKTDADAEAAAKLNAIKSVLGDGDVVDQVKALAAQVSAGSEAARENAIVALVGAKQNADGSDNVRFNYLNKQTAGLSGEKLNAALEAVKADPVMLALNAQVADGNSGINIVAPKANAGAASSFEGSASVEL